MGLFGWFGKSGVPVDASTVLKRMSADKRDFDGVALNSENHPANVYECGEVVNTSGGKTRVCMLYPCRDTVSTARVKLKKRQAEMFYVSPSQFTVEFGWEKGGRVKITAKIIAGATSFAEWLRANVTSPGENVTADMLSRKLDKQFSSDSPPEWLSVVEREDFAEPEPPPAPEEPPAPTVADFKPGVEVFGHYKIEKELGSGGQGTVFLATDLATVVEERRHVVLKILRCDSCGDETSLNEFVKEANTLSSLRDDRIAACYWCQPLGGVPILAMEYVDGVPLNEYLAHQEDGKISESETRELLQPIAEALDYAHAKGIYHRDVKPHNIIVRRTPKTIGNKKIRTCLLDFGIASRELAGGSHTTFLSVRGTIQYMSPEQKMIGRRPSASMDVYSLAVTAYECIAGEMPYPDGWDRDTKPTPIPSNTDFARAIMRGLEMLPENRPPTCCELINPPPGRVDPPHVDEPHVDDKKAQGPSPKDEPETPRRQPVPPRPSTPDDIAALEHSFVNYRKMLAQSAAKCDRESPQRAEWLRSRQAALRDLTRDLGSADGAALKRFFEENRERITADRMSPDDFFQATSALVELRNGLPKSGGAVWSSLKGSIY